MRKENIAIKDLVGGLIDYKIWTMLAWLEIKQRYRRSVIGPLWLTLSTGIMVVAMGPIYGHMFKQNLDIYFLYLATSIVSWQFISAIINESCIGFTSVEGYIKQGGLKYSIFIYKIVYKNIIIFIHNSIIIIILMIIYKNSISLSIFLTIIGLLIVSINGVWLAMIIAIACSRYRDINQVVGSIVGVAFFITPIMWYPKMLGSNDWIIYINPLFYFIEIIREPIMGGEINLIYYLISFCIFIIGFSVMIFIMNKSYKRIAYWI